MSDSTWYYERAGQPAGPVPLDDLRALAARGDVRPDTRIWSDGMAGWESAQARLPELFAPAAPAAAPAATPAPSVYDAPAPPPAPAPASYAAPAADASAYASPAASAPAAASGRAWHYEHAGQPAGPVDETALRGLVASGVVTAGTRVWSEGMGDWAPAASAVPALFGPGAAVVSPGGYGAPAAGYAPAAYAPPGYGTPGFGQGAYVQPGWFSLEGRLNRLPYFLRSLALGLLVGVAIAALAAIAGERVAMLAYVAVFATVPLTVQRLHDLDLSGWLAVLSLVPCLNLLFGLYLLFAPGTAGPNRYGPDPLGRG